METSKAVLVGDMEHVDYARVPEGSHVEGVGYDFYAVKNGYRLVACTCAAHSDETVSECEGDSWGVKVVAV